MNRLTLRMIFKQALHADSMFLFTNVVIQLSLNDLISHIEASKNPNISSIYTEKGRRHDSMEITRKGNIILPGKISLIITSFDTQEKKQYSEIWLWDYTHSYDEYTLQTYKNKKQVDTVYLGPQNPIKLLKTCSDLLQRESTGKCILEQSRIALNRLKIK